jgi:hypothetical protein
MATDSSLGQWISRLSTMAGLFVVFCLFYLGSQPVAVGIFQHPYDKLAHFAVFSLITLLLGLGFFKRRKWLLFFVVSSIAFMDEFTQSWLPGRHSSSVDFMMDLLAVIVTVILLKIFVSRKENTYKRTSGTGRC